MQLDVAKTAGTIAGQIEGLTAVIAQIDVLLAEASGWELFSCQVRAKETGASQPAGTVVNLLPFGVANDANTLASLQAARATYQVALDALNAQLSGI